MTDPVAAYLSGGTRLHLQHGPIDLIIGVDGDRATASDAAKARFASVLDELVAELPDLRCQMRADTSFSGSSFVFSWTAAHLLPVSSSAKTVATELIPFFPLNHYQCKWFYVIKIDFPAAFFKILCN